MLQSLRKVLHNNILPWPGSDLSNSCHSYSNWQSPSSGQRHFPNRPLWAVYSEVWCCDASMFLAYSDPAPLAFSLSLKIRNRNNKSCWGESRDTGTLGQCWQERRTVQPLRKTVASQETTYNIERWLIHYSAHRTGMRTCIWPKTHIKNMGVVARACNPSIGKGRQEIPGAHGIASVDKLSDPRPVRDLTLKNQRDNS